MFVIKRKKQQIRGDIFVLDVIIASSRTAYFRRLDDIIALGVEVMLLRREIIREIIKVPITCQSTAENRYKSLSTFKKISSSILDFLEFAEKIDLHENKFRLYTVISQKRFFYCRCLWLKKIFRVSWTLYEQHVLHLLQK